MLGYDHFLTRLGYSSLFNLGEPSHSLSLSSRLTTPTKLEDLFNHILLIMRLDSWLIKGYCQKRQVTYSLINSVLLLKTPGGSSSIWLLPNSLGKDIPWFQLKVLLFRNCCYRGFFHFCLLDWQFICVVPASNTRLCYNLDIFVIFWYLSI